MRRLSIGLTAALLMAAVAAPALATPRDTNGEHKVVVCHATSSDSNPYVRIVVDVASTKLMGHLEHQDNPNKSGKDGIERPDVIGPVGDEAFICPGGGSSSS